MNFEEIDLNIRILEETIIYQYILDKLLFVDEVHQVSIASLFKLRKMRVELQKKFKESSKQNKLKAYKLEFDYLRSNAESHYNKLVNALHTYQNWEEVSINKLDASFQQAANILRTLPMLDNLRYLAISGTISGPTLQFIGEQAIDLRLKISLKLAQCLSLEEIDFSNLRLPVNAWVKLLQFIYLAPALKRVHLGIIDYQEGVEANIEETYSNMLINTLLLLIQHKTYQKIEEGQEHQSRSTLEYLTLGRFFFDKSKILYSLFKHRLLPMLLAVNEVNLENAEINGSDVCNILRLVGSDSKLRVLYLKASEFDYFELRQIAYSYTKLTIQGFRLEFGNEETNQLFNLLVNNPLQLKIATENEKMVVSSGIKPHLLITHYFNCRQSDSSADATADLSFVASSSKKLEQVGAYAKNDVLPQPMSWLAKIARITEFKADLKK
ncbi:hypothetical protein [Rickettsiales endosymbiont of Stachyamoeba lipophora]|uniref:hypothetical protein n=1 Tax=Rickettsiales endosymbiont of Stachyamoeba lipophora TaxID=2486578 RepID=UPI000F648009|nr:hypothetical protein [Rickettsiales endosymbiont of Stachyamoeba lipophora]AZL14959.1 hypothetical protein EF513_00030 [Rickettsiales endosymbiont of Stachyamoeba lipophora]